jgi:hypothetical protein
VADASSGLPDHHSTLPRCRTLPHKASRVKRVRCHF